MEFNLQVGLSSKIETVVTENDTASSFGSGVIKVLATPMMIGLMETPPFCRVTFTFSRVTPL